MAIPAQWGRDRELAPLTSTPTKAAARQACSAMHHRQSQLVFADIQAEGLPHILEHPQQSQPHHKRVHAAREGAITGAPGSGDQRGLHYWAPHDAFYVRPLLSRQGDVA